MNSTVADSPDSISEQPDDSDRGQTPQPIIAHLHLGVEWPLLVQRGQRRFGPNPNIHEKPTRGAEIFLGRLPFDCFEDEIFLFVTKSINPESIYEIRVMLDPINRGLSRRFAFVQLVNKEIAAEAVLHLNNLPIRPGFLVAVKESVDNCKLFFGGLPRNKTRKEILTEVSKIVEGVNNVTVYPSAEDKSKNRGFAFIQFESHQLAAQARQKFQRQNLNLWSDVEVQVDWAEPEKDVNDSVMSKVKVLFIRNLMMDTTEETIHNAFAPFGTIERVKKLRDYAFIHFETREEALKALDEMNGKDLDGATIEVQLAKPPPPKTKHNRPEAIPMYAPLPPYPTQQQQTFHPLLGNMSNIGFDPNIFAYNMSINPMLNAVPSNFYGWPPTMPGQTARHGIAPNTGHMFPYIQTPFVYPRVSSQVISSNNNGMIIHQKAVGPIVTPPESLVDGRTQKKLRRNATGQAPKHSSSNPIVSAANGLPPTHRNSLTSSVENNSAKLASAHSQQKLTELCIKAGYFYPNYNTNVIPLNMVSNGIGGDAVTGQSEGGMPTKHQTMYVCDVTLTPNLNHPNVNPMAQVLHVRPDKLMMSLDEAKGYAAEYIIKNLNEVLNATTGSGALPYPVGPVVNGPPLAHQD